MVQEDTELPSVEQPRVRVPLKGRRVLVTRPRNQSGEMTALLEQLGATVIHCPTIEIIEPSSWAALDAAIDRLHTYDWLVFTSSNGASSFFRRLIERRSDGIAIIANVKVCAIGPATAKAIESFGARAEVIATDSKAEGALKAITEHVGNLDKLRGLRFLIPRARIGRDLLPTELTQLGAQVDDVEAYQTVKPSFDSASLIELFTEGKIDAVTFTSSSTISNFAALVGQSDLSSLTGKSVIACIGPITAATAQEYGLKNIIQPEAYTAAALVDALARRISDP